jgi:hypothetical protein
VVDPNSRSTIAKSRAVTSAPSCFRTTIRTGYPTLMPRSRTICSRCLAAYRAFVRKRPY